MTFALFILYVVLSYVHPGEVVPALASYRVAYWIGSAGLLVAVGSFVARRGPGLATLQFAGLISFAIATCASLMLADRWLGAPLVVIQRFGPSIAMFVLATAGVGSLRRLRLASNCIIGLTLILAIQALAAYHFGYNSRLFLLHPAARGEEPSGIADDSGNSVDVDEAADLISEDDGADLTRIRGLGMMHDPNDLAMGLVVAVGLIAGIWRAAPGPRNVALTLAAGVLIYGVYLTRSRGGVLALAIVLWRWASRRIGRFPAAILFAALVAGILALDYGGRQFSIDPDESAAGRLTAWTEGLEMLKMKPILGVGYGQFLEYHTLTAHNSLVLCFAETGLIGCFFWVGLLVVTLLELRALRSLADGDAFDEIVRDSAEGLHLSLIGFLAASFFLSRTFVPTLYLIIGLAAALTTIARNSGRRISLPAFPALGTFVLGCELASIAVVYAIVKWHVA
jgi:putative inorganic carbon (hco3(-)) transporter